MAEHIARNNNTGVRDAELCGRCCYAADERMMSDACVDGSSRVIASLKDESHLDPERRTLSQGERGVQKVPD